MCAKGSEFVGTNFVQPPIWKLLVSMDFYHLPYSSVRTDARESKLGLHAAGQRKLTRNGSQNWSV